MHETENIVPLSRPFLDKHGNALTLVATDGRMAEENDRPYRDVANLYLVDDSGKMYYDEYLVPGLRTLRRGNFRGTVSVAPYGTHAYGGTRMDDFRLSESVAGKAVLAEIAKWVEDNRPEWLQPLSQDAIAAEHFRNVVSMVRVDNNLYRSIRAFRTAGGDRQALADAMVDKFRTAVLRELDLSS